MRHKSAQLKKDIYDFVSAWSGDHGVSPTLQTIADHLGVSRPCVLRYLREMTEEGTLTYTGGHRGTIETRRMNARNTAFASAALVGSIPCGEPLNEEEYVEEYVNLPASLFGRGEFYLLRAEGDSMLDAGIWPGDMLVIRHTAEAREGQIVAALDEDGQSTLKLLGGRTADGKVLLRYMNEADYPGRTIAVTRLTVQGVVTGIIRNMENRGFGY